MPACHAGDRRFKSDRGRHTRYSKIVIRGSKGEGNTLQVELKMTKLRTKNLERNTGVRISNFEHRTSIMPR